MVSPKLSPKLETGLFNSILSTSIKMSQNHFAFPSQLGAGCSDQTPEAIFFSLCLSYPHLIHQPVSVVPPSESPRICSLHPTPPLCPLLLPGPYNSPPDLLLMVVVSHIPSPQQPALHTHSEGSCLYHIMSHPHSALYPPWPLRHNQAVAGLTTGLTSFPAIDFPLAHPHSSQLASCLSSHIRTIPTLPNVCTAPSPLSGLCSNNTFSVRLSLTSGYHQSDPWLFSVCLHVTFPPKHL